ncbi:NAD(P)H-dependent oxidoreductase [Bradyrhizobium sp. Arg237L]|uniref:NAD(P)H-dependent oxidoreductase n=1 Tax=Bradyrhizobium sp. Arg237L TaxID=3003352 RepID=UPI00249D8D95|nr:NAD(P)H-dependent oxidoreductase [Bradyrhizobium sp. Arg237L]MDI4238627.1 NAD(P)H-dependent oxidoreductase [Bradyrhizobium sp. Arg237L]
MRQILVINSSVSGEASVSRVLVEDVVQRLLEANPGAVVTYRDLGDGSIPHLTPATVSGVRAVARTDDELNTQALSDELIAELQAADVVVIGAPMYNFSIPSSLRAWFDHVLRPRVTFTYNEAGPQGLLTGKRAIVIEPRGGVYSEGPTNAIDFQEPYLKQLLGFVGIADVTFIHAEKIGYGPEAREFALTTARSRIAEAAARIAAGSGRSDSDVFASDEAKVPAAGIASSSETSIDYDAMMQPNLARVFGEHDPSRRIKAIRELYDEDAELHEPQRSVRGHDAISQAVAELLAHLPPEFAFSAIRPALGHNGVGRLQWRAGPPDGPAAVTGIDVAHIEGGVIRSLHVFLDQPGA